SYCRRGKRAWPSSQRWEHKLKAAVKKSENQPRRNEEHEVFFWYFLSPSRFFVVDSHCFRASQRDMNALQTPISYKKEKVAGTHLNLPPSTGNHVLYFIRASLTVGPR